ncbi:hypothetical protein M9H77_06483 [Catharanthus roseus]|uniref:Uncharacterized protein n=1 Tax=Catharanthus roseus TaxID=4058 RepID=A0ACC0BS90_CATRO|nr:hypothetical protein M9H77_06483 [Catharanthus roseus]
MARGIHLAFAARKRYQNQYYDEEKMYGFLIFLGILGKKISFAKTTQPSHPTFPTLLRRLYFYPDSSSARQTYGAVTRIRWVYHLLSSKVQMPSWSLEEKLPSYSLPQVKLV